MTTTWCLQPVSRDLIGNWRFYGLVTKDYESEKKVLRSCLPINARASCQGAAQPRSRTDRQSTMYPPMCSRWRWMWQIDDTKSYLEYLNTIEETLERAVTVPPPSTSIQRVFEGM
ncbi:hypothetical protein FPOA_03349 [Fusarium poae]|uniref:Uncharacterized protein n=1 Tax=Fusarium poae TaxID=36050 RepID=A0A1B8B9L8_FUSPO|nr:hypothetical protein FPOA_03349 [Fusarium poae]